MTGIRSLVATGTFGLLAVVALFGGAPGASAGEVSSITIHHRLCPIDQTITDYFAQCHDELVGTALGFTLESDSDSQTVETDVTTSNVTIETTPDTVEIFGGVPGEFATTFVYCSQDQVEIDVTATGMGVSFDAPAGEVVCDWYNTPIDLRGDGDGDGDSAGNGGVTTLPNTGVGIVGSDSSGLFLALLSGLGAAGAVSMIARRRHA